MKDGFRLKRDVYVILAVIILLALTLQIARSQYVLQFSRNGSLAEDREARAAAAVSLSPEEYPGPAYCVLYDSRDSYSVDVKNNVARMLQYMKKKAVATDTSAGEAVDFQGCAAVVITNESLDPIPDILSLSDYVEGGGYALIAGQLENDSAYFRL
ncbi:DUF2194 domain-containing protein [Paenibacillus sp. M1]|uniref:DUF2194 domain-containing protein n=1 Tax=Paenibacillus haidiansis TaxID=1574488 RepID=A0ABU7VV73_9BACL